MFKNSYLIDIKSKFLLRDFYNIINKYIYIFMTYH